MQNKPDKTPMGPGKDPRKSNFSIGVTLLITIAILFLANYSKNLLLKEEITYDKFLNLVKDHQIQEVVITNSSIEITPKPDSEFHGKSLYTISFEYL